MKKYLQLILIFILFVGNQKLFAQRNYKLIVTEVSTNIGDCDGGWAGDSDPLWRFYINGDCQDRYETECNGCTRTVSYTIYNQSFDCSGSQPTSLTVGLSGCENDGATSCSVPVCDGSASTGSWTENLPSTTGTFGDISRSVTNGGGCQSGKTFSFKYHWEVTGNFRSTAYDDICNAYDLGSVGANASATSPSYYNICATVNTGGRTDPVYAQGNDGTDWYTFTTPSVVPAQYYFKFNNISDFGTWGGLEGEIYKKTGGTCPPTLSYVGSWDPSGCGVTEESGGFCLEASTTYYVMADPEQDGACGGRGTYQLVVRGGVDMAAPDNICNAVRVGSTDIGVNQSATTATYTNSCSSVNTGGNTDPSNAEGNDGTDWYYFTTPSTVAAQYYLNFTNEGDFGTYGGLEGEIYKKTGGTCPPTLSYVGSWDPSGCGVTEESGGFCLDPSSTYYVMADPEQDGLCGGRGKYKLRVRGSNTIKAPDTQCSAYDLGTVSYNGNSSSPNNMSNECAGNGDLPENCDDNLNVTWFKFTTPSTSIATKYRIRVFQDPAGLGDDLSPEVEIYSGTCSSLNYVKCNDPLSGNADFDLDCPSPSTTYFIKVSGDGCLTCDATGVFQVRVDGSGIIVTGNDLCSQAISLGTLTPGGTIGDAAGANRWNNFCATTAGDPDPGWTLAGVGTSPYQTVWFKFNTGNAGRDISIDGYNDPGSHGDQIDIKLALYGGSCGSLSLIDKDYDTPPYSETMEGNYCLTPNTDYYILLGGSNFDFATGSTKEGFFGLTVQDNGPYPGNDLLCNVSSVTTYDIGDAATVATNVGTVNNISKTGTNIKGTNCFDPNPTWGGICAAAFNNDNDYGVWYKLPAATNRKDIFIKGVASSVDPTDLQYALYEASAPTNCTNPGVSLVTNSYYGALAWNSLGGTCASADENHVYTCLDPTKDYYLMVDGNDQLISCGTGNFTLNTYYPKEGGLTPCTAEWLPGVTTSSWSAGIHKIDLAANFCGSTYVGIPNATWNYEKPVWWKFVAPPSGSVELRIKSDSTNLGDELRPKIWVFEENSLGDCSNTALNNTNLDQKDPDDLLEFGDPDLLTEILDVRCLVPGRTYYVVTDGVNTIAEVCGSGTKVGFFSLEIKDLGQFKRVNDTICGATPGRVAGNPYYFTPSAAWKTVNKEAELTKTNQDNYCFVTQNEPQASAWGGEWSTSNNARGGWYSFTAPPSGKVEIELNNRSVTSDQIDAQIAVYRIKTGYTCNQVQSAASINNPATSPLEFYGSSNDLYAGILADEDLTVSCLMPDSLYYIYVEGVNSNTLGINDLATGEFDLTIRSYPQDPPAKNDNKCNPIYLGQPANAIGSTTGIINAQSAANFNRNMTIPAGAPTVGTNGVTLVKPTNNHGGVYPVSNPPGGNEVALSCAPNPGCIDDISGGDDYDRFEYPFNNFCASAVGDSTPANWGAVFGAINGAPRKSVWFMFKAPADLDGNGEEAVEIDLNQELISLNPNRDAINLRGAVFESSDNTCNGNFYDIKSEYDAENFDETFKVTCLEPNRFYWLMVDGSNINDEGYFGITIKRVTPDPRPSNDYICNAHTLSNSFFTGGAVTRNGDTNICARITRTAIDPTSENDPFGFDLDHTVWYKFTAPTTGVPATGSFAVQVDVNGWGAFPFGFTDKMDPQIAIYESQDGTCNWGTDGANMVEIASEYDILPFTESMKAYCIVPGKTYYVMVDGSALNTQGYFNISIDNIAPITIPTNDDLVNAIQILPFPTNIGAANTTTSVLSHNYCTDIEPGELDSWTLYDIDNTVWWKFQVPNSGAYVNQHVDMQIRLRSDPGSTKNDNINLLGAVYHQIGGTAGSPGTFTNINDNIATGTNILLFDEDINLTCLKPGDWYFLQIDGYSGPFNIFRAQGQGWYDIQLEVTGLTPNQGNDSVCGAITIPVNNVAQPTTGQPYNNICKTVQANENLPWINADDKTVWFKFIPPLGGNVTIEVQSQAADEIDAQIAVYQSLVPIASSTCPPVNQLILVDKDYDALAWGEDLTVRCLDNQYWHYIQVNSANIGLAQEGKFKIKIQDIGGTTNPPYNDNICNAKDFGNVTNANGTGAFAVVGDSNKCASIQLNEPNTISNPSSDIQKSVWYKFTAPTSGRAKITLHDADGFLSGIDPEMKVYEGTVTGCPSNSPTFSNFIELESAYNPLPNFPSSTTGDEVIEYECFTPGQVYYIQVDGTTVGGPQGFFDIKIEDLLPNYNSSPKKPGNDEPANAIPLTVNQQQCPVPIGVSSTGDELQGNGTWYTGNYKKPSVTKKDLIGSCNTLDNCGDIWYRFNMPNDDCMLGSAVAIQGYSDRAPNIGDQYYNDLKVIAYRGTPGSLVPIDCGQVDGNITTNDYFHFEITGTPGETIYLQVFDQNYNDTDNDDEEDFFICVGKRFGLDKCQDLNNVPFMEYEKDYCWNIEGASGETPASAYGETNSNVNPTENSAYFKFKMTPSPCDSIKITIWQPTPPNRFLADGSTNPNQIVSLSIYREDNMLCDGTIDGALITKSYICSSPTAILDNTISFNVGVSNLDTNKVYIIQIDGQGQSESGYINDGFIRIDTFQRCVNVQAVTYDDTSTGYWRCADGWRYYHDKNNVIIFALHPNGNNFDGVAKIRYKTTYDEATSCAAKMAEYNIRRIWDFNITSGSINPLQPVKVRFYYIAAEKTAIINAANAFLASCGGFYEPFEWFKTAAGIQYIPTNPAQINPAYITAGYSETGCRGGDLFGNPNGCSFLTALDNQYSCNGVLYVELGAIVNFSGGTGAAGVGPWENTSPLPVQLTSFTGYNDGNKNVLNWTTASELNSLKYVVERSSSNSGPFSYIGELPAAGNSTQVLHYTLDDNAPLDGANYYRLKMIDLDGTFEYSQTILINIDKPTVYENTIESIFPNPTHNEINVDYISAENSTIVLRIYDALGQEMLKSKQEVVRGNQLFKTNVNTFANGVYIIQIQDVNSGKILQAKFVKD